MRPLFCPRLSRRRAFLALLGALPAAHGGLGQELGSGRRADAGSGYCPRRKESRRMLCVLVRRHEWH